MNDLWLIQLELYFVTERLAVLVLIYLDEAFSARFVQATAKGVIWINDVELGQEERQMQYKESFRIKKAGSWVNLICQDLDYFIGLLFLWARVFRRLVRLFTLNVSIGLGLGLKRLVLNHLGRPLKAWAYL